MILFFFSFSLVYNLKLSLFHLPQDFRSSTLAMSGLLAIADGMAALKLWPRMSVAWLPKCGFNRISRVSFKPLDVSSFPEEKAKQVPYPKVFWETSYCLGSSVAADTLLDSSCAQ